VAHRSIARQRLSKYIPRHTRWTIGHSLLGNGPINTHSWQQKTVFSVGSVPRSYKRAQSDLEMIEAKAFRTFIRIYSLLKSESLSAKIKLTLQKALIRTGITYACPAWELAADTYLLKLQRLHNKVLRTIGNFPRCTPVRDMHTVLTFHMYMII
jgi:hypothetical protein